MKDLFIIRHAKSSWSQPGLADHERPLNERGRTAAADMGQRLVRRVMVPERLVSSDALRARQTAELMGAEMALETGAIVFEPRLYDADADDWLVLVGELPDELGRVAMLGHNPAAEEFAEYLLGLHVDKFPTATVVHACLDVDRWADASPGNARCMDFDYPKKRG